MQKIQTLLKSKLLKRYIRYNIVGGLGTAIYLALLFISVELFHVTPVKSVIIAFTVNVLFNYILSYHWVFTGHDQSHAALLRFMIVSGVGFVLNVSIMFLVVHIMHAPYYFAVILSMFIVPLTNFILHHFWSFRKRSES